MAGKTPAKKKGAKSKAPKQKKTKKTPKTGQRKNNAGPMRAPPSNVASSVTDGVNVGMVWRNSNQVRDHFQRRFEKVADIAPGSTAYSVILSFFLNPGNSVLFPVFSQIASTYEEYICHCLRFWYRGEEYMASGTNVSAGIVAMVTNMDPDDSQFTNISQLENYEGSVSGPPFAGHFVHDVAVAHKTRGRNRTKGDALSLNQYFVFSSANIAAPTGQMAKFFDMGQFQCAVNGCQAATPAGELWVEHEWTLIRRKQETPIGQQALYAHLVESPAATAAAAGSAFLGTTGGILRAGSTIPIVATGSTFTLPIAGTYLVSSVYSGSVTVGPTYTLGGNLTTNAILLDNANAFTQAVSGNTTVDMRVITVTANGTAAANTVTISVLTNLAAGKVDIIVAQVSGGILLALQKSKDARTAFAALCERLDQLEKKVGPVPCIEHSRECSVSEPDTPCEEIKEDDLVRSIHIPAAQAGTPAFREALLKGLGLTK